MGYFLQSQKLLLFKEPQATPGGAPGFYKPWLRKVAKCNNWCLVCHTKSQLTVSSRYQV